MNFEQSSSRKQLHESADIYVHRFILMNDAFSLQWYVIDRIEERKKERKKVNK
jgi:hypothetical protein